MELFETAEEYRFLVPFETLPSATPPPLRSCLSHFTCRAGLPEHAVGVRDELDGVAEDGTGLRQATRESEFHADAYPWRVR